MARLLNWTLRGASHRSTHGALLTVLVDDRLRAPFTG
jgi:hypothetical protein